MSRINQLITAPQVRLVGENGEKIGIVSLKEALHQAELAGLDLVEIAPTAEPPVCRIMNHGKHLFEIGKKKAGQRKKQKQTRVKEVKFRSTTGEHDYRIKVSSITRFLEDGDKVKVTIRFRGRELMHADLGMALLAKIEADLTGVGVVEQRPNLEGKQIVMMIAPRKAG